MNTHSGQAPDDCPAAPEPANQVQSGDGDDATSGSEGGGPRVGYSEPAESERLKFPAPAEKKPGSR